MPEPETPPAETSQQDWEENLTPERAMLKDFTSFVDSVLQTTALVDRPAGTISGYAEEFLRKYASELPASEAKRIDEKRQTLKEKSLQQATDTDHIQ